MPSSVCQLAAIFLCACGTLAIPVAIGAAESQPRATPPTVKTIKFRANGMSSDTVAHALVAAAKIHNRTADYAELASRSGNAWAPAINATEDCTSHMAVEGFVSDRELPTLAAAIGLNAEKIALPAFTGNWGEDAVALEYRKKIAPLLTPHLAKGETLLTVGGWQPQGKAFTHWAWAGFINEVRDDGTILGTHLNGRNDAVIYVPDTTWALSAGKITLTPFQADRSMLVAARDRILGQGNYKATDRHVFGLAAMDAWIKHMRTTQGFCQPCEKRSQNGWHDARNNTARSYELSTTLVAYLKKRLPDWPADSRPAAQSIVAHYEKIQSLLAPTAKGEDLKLICTNLEKQNKYADDVLLPMKRELEGVATDLQKLLAAWPAP